MDPATSTFSFLPGTELPELTGLFPFTQQSDPLPEVHPQKKRRGKVLEAIKPKQKCKKSDQKEVLLAKCHDMVNYFYESRLGPLKNAIKMNVEWKKKSPVVTFTCINGFWSAEMQMAYPVICDYFLKCPDTTSVNLFKPDSFYLAIAVTFRGQ